MRRELGEDHPDARSGSHVSQYAAVLGAFRASPAGAHALAAAGGAEAEAALAERAAKEAMQVTRLHLGLAPSDRLRVEGDEALLAALSCRRPCADEEADEEPSELRPRVDTWLERERRWDCETIVSTYSNLENRPSVIDEGAGRPRRRPPSAAAAAEVERPIRLGKTGMPVDFLPHARRGDAEYEDGSGSEDAEAGAADWRSNTRRKGETAEEKRARKAAVKEGRRDARASKKETRVIFAKEAAATRPQLATGAVPRGASVLPLH
jgi:protein LTV1